MMTAHNVSLQEAREYLNDLDLNYIVRSMMSPQYPLPRWTSSDALHCCRLYKNFLWLQKKYEHEALVPTREIDEFWHNHILHTQRYMHDCMNIFGHYLHHVPASPDEDTTELLSNYQKTKDLYFHEFNESLTLAKSS